MEQKFETAIMDLTTNIFLIVNKEDIVVDCNKRASLFLGRKKIKGKSLDNIFDAYSFEELKRHIANVIEAELPVNFIFAQDRRIYDCRIYPYDFGFVLYFDDITELVENQNVLKNIKAKAKKLSKESSYFIAQASHDLRQPIQALRMFIYQLKKDKLSKKQSNVINNMDFLVENLTLLLDNLIDISKLNCGANNYTPYLFNLSKMVDKVVREFKDLAISKHIDFCVKNKNLSFYGNPFFVERIIRNLLSNAFKYTNDCVALNIEKSDNEYIIISVSDNGKGISKKDIKYIFNEFFQVENEKYSINNKGSGLGLAIVKKMSDLLGGKIEVESKLSVGSEFIVRIPINKKEV